MLGVLFMSEDYNEKMALHLVAHLRMAGTELRMPLYIPG